MAYIPCSTSFFIFARLQSFLTCDEGGKLKKPDPNFLPMTGDMSRHADGSVFVNLSSTMEAGCLCSGYLSTFHHLCPLLISLHWYVIKDKQLCSPQITTNLGVAQPPVQANITNRTAAGPRISTQKSLDNKRPFITMGLNLTL